jgi:hypothetical protein
VAEGRPSPEEYKLRSQWAHESTGTVKVSAFVPAPGCPVSSVMQMKSWHKKKKLKKKKRGKDKVRKLEIQRGVHC